MNSKFDTKQELYYLDVFVLESDCETIKYLDNLDKHISLKSLIHESLTNSLELFISNPKENQLNLAQVFNKNTLDFYNTFNIMFTPQ